MNASRRSQTQPPVGAESGAQISKAQPGCGGCSTRPRAQVAFGDCQKQRLVARAAVHVLTVASPGRKSFTPRPEIFRAGSLSEVRAGQPFRAPAERQPARGRDHRQQSGNRTSEIPDLRRCGQAASQPLGAIPPADARSHAAAKIDPWPVSHVSRSSSLVTNVGVPQTCGRSRELRDRQRPSARNFVIVNRTTAYPGDALDQPLRQARNRGRGRASMVTGAPRILLGQAQAERRPSPSSLSLTPVLASCDDTAASQPVSPGLVRSETSWSQPRSHPCGPQ